MEPFGIDETPSFALTICFLASKSHHNCNSIRSMHMYLITSIIPKPCGLHCVFSLTPPHPYPPTMHLYMIPYIIAMVQDHAGHIFGVDSAPMIEKLEQYNEVIERVVGALERQSRPGGLHENTMLLVMGDHGQTLNGDHGGGTSEEVETAIFALTTKNPNTLLAAAESASCQLDVHRRQVCTSSIQQLDFAATVSALLGLPFPFGSIGKVNSELYSLAGGTWNQEESITGDDGSPSEVQSWMLNYVNALCINSWQVKKYIDVYSSFSLIGFSDKDLLHVSELYSRAQELWSITSRNISGAFVSLPLVRNQLDAYSMFLESVAALARSNWTEFNLKIMGIGFCIMLSSLYLNVFLIRRLEKLCGLQSFFSGYLKNFLGVNLACIVILIRAWSFLSNSFILEEGRVASFLLATTAILQLRHAIMKKMMLLEALVLCLLVPFLRISIELGQLKQAVNSLFLKADSSNMLGIVNDSELWMYVAEVLPVLALIIVAYLPFKSITSCSSQGILKYVIAGTLFNYMLILLNLASESSLLSPNLSLWLIKGNLIPQVIYAFGLLQLSLLVIGQLIDRGRTSNMEESTVVKALALISACSSTTILLSGKQGPLAFLALLIGGWCLIRLMALEQNTKNNSSGSSLFYALPVTQWSLLAVCMFFSTGHWCAFDGLRYAAAFIGFDEFNLIRQAILLTIDTFGFSHVLPIFGLPLVARGYLLKQSKIVYLMYGLITAIATTFTMLCVAIQRRHLMVWGLFAPKFVFDVFSPIDSCIISWRSARVTSTTPTGLKEMISKHLMTTLLTPGMS
ncbi:GPI ethanolamine phosphate transferase 3-like isoform X2 [Salvia splendens]|uniref:GPI ethanolamine phosphate transferase 3-like isoform X2 n=1 Tax=Salvia splendens TaxID=180675 RepID=UPI001C26B7BA|nr:GPI ethanolamine phosphate transferase 3-like isoform X2 [Salvia splendens]